MAPRTARDAIAIVGCDKRGSDIFFIAFLPLFLSFLYLTEYLGAHGVAESRMQQMQSATHYKL